MPREGIYTCVFCPPPPLSDENPVMLHFFAYAEIIFAHILVFPACVSYYSYIEDLGLHAVYITRYVIGITKHLRNRIETIEIERQ